MHANLRELTYDIELGPGEELTLPSEASSIVGPGWWRVTIGPAQELPLRDHSAFLNSYEPDDEGLDDDYQAG